MNFVVSFSLICSIGFRYGWLANIAWCSGFFMKLFANGCEWKICSLCLWLFSSWRLKHVEKISVFSFERFAEKVCFETLPGAILFWFPSSPPYMLEVSVPRKVLFLLLFIQAFSSSSWDMLKFRVFEIEEICCSNFAETSTSLSFSSIKLW